MHPAPRLSEVRKGGRSSKGGRTNLMIVRPNCYDPLHYDPSSANLLDKNHPDIIHPSKHGPKSAPRAPNELRINAPGGQNIVTSIYRFSEVVFLETFGPLLRVGLKVSCPRGQLFLSKSPVALNNQNFEDFITSAKSHWHSSESEGVWKSEEQGLKVKKSCF